jgi:hypothetical protein
MRHRAPRVDLTRRFGEVRMMWVIIGTVPAEIFSYDPSRAIKVAPSTRGTSASSGLMRVARLAGQPFRAALGNR